MDAPLPFDTVRERRAQMIKTAPVLGALDAIQPAAKGGVEALAARTGSLGTEPFMPAVRDFYQTNPIARASAVMAELSAIKAGNGRIRAAAE